MSSSSAPAAVCSFRESFAIQCRVIWALLMREIITKHGRHNIGFLWMIAEPMIFTLGVTTLWTIARVHAGSPISITVFALTGYSSILLWRTMPGRAESAIKMNQPLLHHRNVRPIDIYIARLSLEAIGVIMCFLSLATIYSWFGLVKPPEDPLKVIFALFMLAWFGFAVALNIGCLSEKTHLVDKIWHPFTYLFMPLSGAGFLVESLPSKYSDYYLKIPTVHAVECLRDGYFGSLFHAKYDMGYLATWNIALLLLGLFQVKSITRHLNK
jgi:ABC-2 type transport system permease protein/capsular polysaccharide transport system permease protein